MGSDITDRDTLIKLPKCIFTGLVLSLLLTISSFGSEIPGTTLSKNDVPEAIIQQVKHSLDMLSKAIEGGDRDSICKWINLPVFVECYADWSKGNTYTDREELKKDIGEIFGQQFVEQLQSSIKNEQLLIEEATGSSDYRYACVVGIYTEEYDPEWGTVESARLFRFYYFDGVFKLGLVYCGG